MSAENILQANGLTKKFNRVLAVDGLDLSIERGVTFGLLGPNGSGKTTTLGMLLGVINPTAGTYNWFSEKSGPAARKRIGAILEAPCFYPYLTARQNLKVVGQIKNCSNAAIEAVLERVGLLQRADSKFSTYSLGMKQRLAIASALLCDPEVLVLDEPTNGLDPEGIADMRELIIQLASENRTIILASHMLDEVQKICSHFAVMRSGKKIFQGTVSEVAQKENTVELDAEDRIGLQNVLKSLPQVVSYTERGKLIEAVLQSDVRPSELNRLLLDRGVELSHLKLRITTLEEQFLQILKSN